MRTPSSQKKEKKFILEFKSIMGDTIDLIYEAFEKLKSAKEGKNLEEILKLEEELVLLRREFVKNSNRKGRVFSES